MSELVKRENLPMEVASVDISKPLPSLDEAEEFPLDLCGNYWTPEKEGEFKRLFFVGFKTQSVLSATGSGDLIDLDCACFVERNEEGSAITVTNGSRRLVGVLEDYVKSGIIKKGTPLKITYIGKTKNKNNAFSSDNWSIRPLIINI